MRPVVVEVAGGESSEWIQLDRHSSPFTVNLAIEVVSGVIDATVEYTLSNIHDPTDTIVAYPHPTLANEAANVTDNMDAVGVVYAVRLVNDGADSVARFRVLQACRS